MTRPKNQNSASSFVVSYLTTTTTPITINVNIPTQLWVCTSDVKGDQWVDASGSTFPLNTVKRFRLFIDDPNLYSSYTLQK